MQQPIFTPHFSFPPLDTIINAFELFPQEWSSSSRKRDSSLVELRSDFSVIGASRKAEMLTRAPFPCPNHVTLRRIIITSHSIIIIQLVSAFSPFPVAYPQRSFSALTPTIPSPHPVLKQGTERKTSQNAQIFLVWLQIPNSAAFSSFIAIPCICFVFSLWITLSDRTMCMNV